MTSLESASPGTRSRSIATLSRYSPRVYPRRIDASMRSEPDCTGRWRYGHSLGQLADRVGHRVVTWLGCEVVKRSRRRPVDRRDARQQPREVGAAVAVGVHRLAEQHHLGVAARDQRLDLGDDVARRPVDLGSPRARHDAEAADVVAALHHRDVGAHRAGSARRPRAGREGVGAAVEVDLPACPARPTRSSSSGTRATVWVPTRTSTSGARRGSPRPGAARRSRPRRSSAPGARPSAAAAGRGRGRASPRPSRAPRRC